VHVVLPKRIDALRWSQFLYEEGAPDGVRVVFSTHDVVVTGCGLDALRADIAAQIVTVIPPPLRTERFVPAAGPRIVATSWSCHAAVLLSVSASNASGANARAC
jgi:hypothetical protein